MRNLGDRPSAVTSLEGRESWEAYARLYAYAMLHERLYTMLEIQRLTDGAGGAILELQSVPLDLQS